MGFASIGPGATRIGQSMANSTGTWILVHGRTSATTFPGQTTFVVHFAGGNGMHGTAASYERPARCIGIAIQTVPPGVRADHGRNRDLPARNRRFGRRRA